MTVSRIDDLSALSAAARVVRRCCHFAKHLHLNSAKYRQKHGKDVVHLLLSADSEIQSLQLAMASDEARESQNDEIADLIDSHCLRRHLLRVCCALAAANLPVLVLLECFAWSAPNECAHMQLSLDAQWRIAKHVRDKLLLPRKT